METWIVQVTKSPEIIAVLLTALLAAIGRLFQPSTRLVWGASHGFTFVIPQQGNSPPNPAVIETGTVFIQNMGRKAAEDVEVVLNFKPQHFQMWPVLNYVPVTTPENHFVIKIENLGPKEYTSLEMLSVNGKLPATLRVRSSLGDAKVLNFAPMRIMPGWFNRFAVLMFLLGFVPVFYLLIRFIKFVAGI